MCRDCVKGICWMLLLTGSVLAQTNESSTLDSNAAQPVKTEKSIGSASAENEANPPEGEERPFVVYTVGNCSRTFREHGRYRTVRDAHQAIETLTPKKTTEDAASSATTKPDLRYWIATGNLSRSWGLMSVNSKKNPPKDITATIFVRGMRCGNWFEHKQYSLDTLEEATKSLRDRKTTFEVVYHIK